MTRSLQFLIVFFVVLLSAVACGSPEPSTERTSSTAVVQPTPVPTPSESATDSGIGTSIDADIPAVPESASIPTEPTFTPIPSPTPTPTQTPIPTATMVLPSTTIDDLGFTLALDGDIALEKSGLSSANADAKEGIIFFEYGGSNAILLWLEDESSSIDAILSDSYTSLDESQPDLSFTLIKEGELATDFVAGKYVAFVADSGSVEDESGGLIGSWRCEPDVVFSLTVTGSDAAVVQIRFKRILDGFACDS